MKPQSKQMWEILRDERKERKANKLAIKRAEEQRAKSFGQYNPDVLALIASAPYSAKIKVQKDKVILSHQAEAAARLAPNFDAYADNLYLQELKAQVELEENFYKARKELSKFYAALRRDQYN